mgnify:CR=1 FL=1
MDGKEEYKERVRQAEHKLQGDIHEPIEEKEKFLVQVLRCHECDEPHVHEVVLNDTNAEIVFAEAQCFNEKEGCPLFERPEDLKCEMNNYGFTVEQTQVPSVCLGD